MEITLTNALQNYLAYENYLDKYSRKIYSSLQHLKICCLLLTAFPIRLKIII